MLILGMARSSVFLGVVGAGWLLGVAYGFHLLWRHSATPAAQVRAVPETWPAASTIPRDARFTLVMAVHPRCPCTRATMAELAELISSAGPKLACHLLFLQPEGVDESWTRTEYWNRAGELGATRHVDRGGVEGQRFGATTSGHTALYDPAGRLVFTGGITAARGHLGDNVGRRAVVAAVASPVPGCAITPVFGCPLVGPSDLPTSRPPDLPTSP